MKNSLLFLAFMAIAPVTSQAQSTDEPKNESLSVTVYNNNLGVIREVRAFDIAKGSSQIKLRDVPDKIDATSVKVSAPKHKDAVTVVEQNYQFDLVSQQKLLEKFIDKGITLFDEQGKPTTGNLLAVEDGKMTLATANGVTMYPNISKYVVNVPALPSSLITKPTLVWTLDADQQLNAEPLEVSFQTAGMNWHTEYIATLSNDEHSLDLSGWVSIDNRSGASYPNAKLKLVAGDIHRAPSAIQRGYGMGADVMAAKSVRPQFEEHGMFEYHVYDLQRETTLMNNEEKQVSLLSAERVSCEKTYTYRGGRNAEVSISFQNSEKNNLGMPLPMGKIRMMKHDKDGSLELLGEDEIQHTPRDEKLTLKVGDAFDVIGERTVTDQHNTGSNSNSETIEIAVKNHKDENITIDVVENVGGSWDITHNSIPYDKKNAYEVVFHVPVKARGEEKVSYTIIHHW